MYYITTKKASGVISGAQTTENGPIQWGRELPNSCLLSQGKLLRWVAMSVCLHPINVKTVELIRPPLTPINPRNELLKLKNWAFCDFRKSLYFSPSNLNFRMEMLKVTATL